MATALRKGSLLGKYLLERRLDKGAFAEVWAVKDTVAGGRLALKVALPEIVAEVGRKKIEHEARIASRLHHPNIVAIRNADWAGDRFIIATDLARSNLAHYAQARRSASLALAIIRQVAAGLAYAHSLRIMHRDVKPGNILIFPDRRAALADFGASCLDRGLDKTYTEIGTLGYLAPEQAYGRPSFASDVFSMGLIAYELLTGVLMRWPFEWPPEGYRRLASKVPAPLIPVIRKATQLHPKKRYEDAGELHRAIERVMRRVEEPAATPVKRKRRRGKAKPSPLAVEGLLFRRRHGRNLGMRFTCFRCEGPISEAMAHCPWCGTGSNSFRDLTAYPLVCPSCEKGVRPEWSYCPWCYAGRFVSNGKAPPADAKAARACSRPGCEGRLRPFMRYCPICKTKVKRVWTHEDLKQRCPSCRWPISEEYWRYCPWCGKRNPRAGQFQVRR